MTKSTSTELLEARVHAEEEFALEAWRARIPFPEMRVRAFDHFGYALSEATLRSLVKSARNRLGDLTISREERVERQQDEIDDRIRRARYDLAQAHAAVNTPAPDAADFGDVDEWALAMKVWDAKVTAAAKGVESADRRLASALKDERELHGLNAPTKIEAEVTTRDAASAELDAMLARLDAEATA